MLVDTLLLRAETKAFLLSPMEDQLVDKLVQYIIVIGSQLFHVKFFDALMVRKFRPGVLLVTDLAHDRYLRTVNLDMIVELCSRHVLKFFSVTYITPELRTRILRMRLKFSESLPDNLSFSFIIIKEASMRELTKIDAVL